MPDWSVFSDVDPNAPGLVAGVVKDGAVDAFYSAGVDAPGGEPLHPDTIFYVASIAKQFTAACIASLALDGRLALGDSIRRWLPDLSPSWQPVLVAATAAWSRASQTSPDGTRGYQPPACTR